MTQDWPRYLLFADACESASQGTGWRFVLSSLDTQHSVTAEDYEPEAPGTRTERLALMAALRGLEALDQPSLVTLVCPSRYVLRGVDRGVRQWRDGGWKWECFGRRVPIRDCDLWRRVDQTLKFHQVDCRSWRFGSGTHEPLADAPRSDARRADRMPSSAGRDGTVRLANEPALLVVAKTKRTRRGVIRFAAESRPAAPLPAASNREVAAAG